MKAGFNMNYYSKHSEEFIVGTKEVDMSNLYDFFESHLKKDSKRIMDLGFGSGRDALYFKNKGYDVCAIDPTPEFCSFAKLKGLNDVRCIRAQELDYKTEFDGIWACASLLHVPSNELNDVFKKCYRSLKENGIMYCSFKYGSFEGIRKERFFLDLNEESFNKYIENTGFNVVETLITSDARPDRSEEKWLNVILKK